jgi:hypothetical protein
VSDEYHYVNQQNIRQGSSILTESGPFQKETESHKDVGDGSRQKGHGERRGDQLPGNRGDHGGDQGTQKSSVKQGLNTVADTKNVGFILLQLDGGDCVRRTSWKKVL